MVSSFCSNEQTFRKSASLEALRWLDVVHDAVFVLEGLGRLGVGALVHEVDLEALVEERHHLQSLDDGLRPELDLLENRGIGPEGDGRPRAAARRRPGGLELAGGLAALLELHDVVLAVAVDLEQQPAWKGR
jgi:hypothetical protein